MLQFTFRDGPVTDKLQIKDKDIVLRIVTNFISNSVKFTKSGCVQPFVIPVEEMATAMPELKSLGDSHVCVGVADTGIGLSAEQLEKAKLGLYNSESTVENNAKNSGFGLHLAHQLAEVGKTEFIHSSRV